MIDPFVLWTPILMLAIVALLGFVGCEAFYGVHPRTNVEPATNLVATAGDQQVTLSWDASADAATYLVQRGTTMGGPYPLSITVMTPTTAYVDSGNGLVNGTTYYYVVVAQDSAGNKSDPSNEASAIPVTPTNNSFVTSETVGTLRNDYDGLVGMAIRIGPTPLTINSLGRIFVPGNSGTHVVKVFDIAANQDLPGAKAVVDMTKPAVNNFVFAPLSGSVTLVANASYYIITQEASGGDEWYNLNTIVQTTTVAVVTSAVYGDGVDPYLTDGDMGQAFGPVNFLY